MALPSHTSLENPGTTSRDKQTTMLARGQEKMEQAKPGDIGAQLSARALKKKKRQAKAAMKPAAPAAKVVRGFETPSSVTSGGDESDYSSVPSPPKNGLGISGTPSAGNSPSIRPSALTRAISNLKLHDDAEDARGRRPGTPLADHQTSYSSPLVKGVSSDDDISVKDADLNATTDSYEVRLGSDFSATQNKPKRLYGAVEGGLRTDSPHRKMTASDFEPLKVLGKGTYGTVILVKQHSTGRLFAQKQLKKATLTVQKRLVEQTRSERQILESVNRHPFVVKLYYAFQDQEKLYLILEYAQGGELFQHLRLERMFSEETAAFYLAEMVLALDHLHRHLGVVYRDLKPENCLLDAEGHLLLTDFGLSKVSVDGEEKCHTMGIGTMDYMAPEVIQGKPYDTAVDWWSLGALGYDLMTGAPPFASANVAKTQQKIVHGGKIAMPYYLSPDAKDILARLLRREPRKRLGADMPRDLNTIKNHRFFRRIDWKGLAHRNEAIVPPIQPIITDPEAAENFADEFTAMAMSQGGVGVDSVLSESLGENPFGGFTYVASSSLLEMALEIDI